MLLVLYMQEMLFVAMISVYRTPGFAPLLKRLVVVCAPQKTDCAFLRLQPPVQNLKLTQGFYWPGSRADA